MVTLKVRHNLLRLQLTGKLHPFHQRPKPPTKQRSSFLEIRNWPETLAPGCQKHPARTPPSTSLFLPYSIVKEPRAKTLKTHQPSQPLSGPTGRQILSPSREVEANQPVQVVPTASGPGSPRRRRRCWRYIRSTPPTCQQPPHKKSKQHQKTTKLINTNLRITHLNNPKSKTKSMG